eukprot:scaffold322872_cov19-Tisochrysis_lutea.AAC.1
MDAKYGLRQTLLQVTSENKCTHLPYGLSQVCHEALELTSSMPCLGLLLAQFWLSPCALSGCQPAL